MVKHTEKKHTPHSPTLPPTHTDKHLERVLQEHPRTKSHSKALDGEHEGLDHVRRRLEDVGPHVIQQVGERVLTRQASHTERQVGHCGHCGLSVDQVSVHEGILQQRCHSIHVVLTHLADVLEHEGEGLEDAVLDVQLGHAILVHEAREDGEG